MDRDTVVAPLTACGVAAALSVIRVSGPRTEELVRLFCSRADEILSDPRRVFLSDIYDRRVGDLSCTELLDSALVVFFASPKSFTGEDVAEFSLHWTSFVPSRMIDNILSLGVRVADGGEFSRRAFENGKMDLSRAEAVADLISAQSQQQASLALGQLKGAVYDLVEGLAEPLRDLLAEVEACIDFVDEELFDEAQYSKDWHERLSCSLSELRGYLASYDRGRICREGARVVISGTRNAGKSTLLNAILGEGRAIVSDIAGTTRDCISERVLFDGVLARLWDTAGLVEDESSLGDPIERIGIGRSKELVDGAELLIYLFDPHGELGSQRKLFELISAKAREAIVVCSKSDLLSEGQMRELELCAGSFDIFLSPLRGDGLGALTKLVSERLKDIFSSGVDSASAMVANARHYRALSDAALGIERALAGIDEAAPAEILAHELRHVLSSMEEIVGSTETEDLLGRIFAQFCVGK